MTKIISAFPGTGKSVIAAAFPNVADSDSSRFSKENGEFPANYIAHINRVIAEGKHSHIFVSTHQELRDAFEELGIEFTLVYPSPDLKEEYIERYRKRGSDPAFIKSLENRFDEMVESCADQNGCEHIMLASGEHIWDHFEEFDSIELPAELLAEASSNRYSATTDGHPSTHAQIIPGDGTDDGDEDGSKHKEKKAGELKKELKGQESENKENKSGDGDGEEDGSDDPFGSDDDDNALDALDKIKIPGDDDEEDDDEDDDEDSDTDSDSDADRDEDEDDLDDEEEAVASSTNRIPRDGDVKAVASNGIVIVYYPGMIRDAVVDDMRGRYSVALACSNTIDKVEGNVKFVQYRPGLLGQLKDEGRQYVNVYPKQSRKTTYFGELIKAKWDHAEISNLYDRWEDDLNAMSLDNVPSIQIDSDNITYEMFPELFDRAVAALKQSN